MLVQTCESNERGSLAGAVILNESGLRGKLDLTQRRVPHRESSVAWGISAKE